MADYDLYLEIKEVGEDGTFTGIASVYGEEDLGGDIIDKGAFRKTIAENPMVPILWQHDSKEVIGEGKVKEWQGKILVEATLDLDDPLGQKVYKKLKKKLVKGLSIGFYTIKSTFEQIEERMVRHIGELKLAEISVVTFPMLTSAQVTRVKQAQQDEIAKLKEEVKALRAELSTLTQKVEAGARERAADQATEPDDHSWAKSYIEGFRAELKN